MNEVIIKERPILFNTGMVQAILEGRKTQTRRVVKPQPTVSGGFLANVVPLWLYPQEYIKEYCRYKIGDRLWVKETFSKRDYPEQILFKQQYETLVKLLDLPMVNIKWRPSIFLSRRDSRITLEITDIKVQRLHDITKEDAIAEGCKGIYSPIEEFANTEYYLPLWESINLKRGYGWDTNPWVWVISFKVLEAK